MLKLTEITGMEGDVITLQDIFAYEKMGITEEGKVVGAFKTTGIRPKFADTLQTSGINLPANIFEPKAEYDIEEEEEE